MKENVGTVDRIGRALAGPALMIVGYKVWGGERGALGGLVAIIAGTAIAESAITRVCPLNALFGLDTREPSLAQRDLKRELSPARLSELAGREI